MALECQLTGKHLVFLYSDRQFFTSAQFQTGDYPCTPGLARGGVRNGNFCLCLLWGSSPLGVPIYGRRISYYMLHLICLGVNLTTAHCEFFPPPDWANVFRAKSDSVLNLPLVHWVFPCSPSFLNWQIPISLQDEGSFNSSAYHAICIRYSLLLGNGVVS